MVLRVSTMVGRSGCLAPGAREYIAEVWKPISHCLCCCVDLIESPLPTSQIWSEFLSYSAKLSFRSHPGRFAPPHDVLCVAQPYPNYPGVCAWPVSILYPKEKSFWACFRFLNRVCLHSSLCRESVNPKLHISAPFCSVASTLCTEERVARAELLQNK